jgi:hypothetical protein
MGGILMGGITLRGRMLRGMTLRVVALVLWSVAAVALAGCRPESAGRSSTTTGVGQTETFARRSGQTPPKTVTAGHAVAAAGQPRTAAQWRHDGAGRDILG